MQKIRRVIDVFIRIERYICCALLVAILVVCFGSVVMRYVFNKPAGDFSETPLIGISFVDGKPVIKTPVVVNTTGFTLSVMASDMADGTGNVTNYKLNASGETKIEEAVKPSRFFRLKVDIPQ